MIIIIGRPTINYGKYPFRKAENNEKYHTSINHFIMQSFTECNFRSLKAFYLGTIICISDSLKEVVG